MNEFNITLTGQLARFTGHPEQWFIGETEVFFATHDQAVATPVNTDLSLAVNAKNEVAVGDGYYVLA